MFNNKKHCLTTKNNRKVNSGKHLHYNAYTGFAHTYVLSQFGFSNCSLYCSRTIMSTWNCNQTPYPNSSIVYTMINNNYDNNHNNDNNDSCLQNNYYGHREMSSFFGVKEDCRQMSANITSIQVIIIK